ncbi:2-keto-myo-inositol dehydratase [Bryocella elongata]|uniref:2-keto-myo-inositol dehydratase n=1 Tax=Bryocella elongata TaxID=863522 RepID=A0A1H5TDN6_9BACT|nr:TIM barrel protein [Bryocella elongata]SEF60955.1 2-keto-myo-inositol dehydratase [Bryocella elongata]
MKPFLIGNAPCSWGMLEFQEAKSAKPIGYQQMLDELAACGYTGTELGDWNFMPSDPAALRVELVKRELTMLGAFVPVALKDESSHQSGIDNAVKTAKLLAAVATTPAPYLVLADNNGSVPERTKLAGRITPAQGLTSSEWATFALGAERVAKAVLEETGLRTVFHHHCAGYVETPAEIASLLERADPALLGLVFDTGHFAFGAGEQGADMISFLDRFADRVWYVHAKDCSASIASRSRNEQWDYFTSLQHGVFCELGKGIVDFSALLKWLRSREYSGYIVVEQDVLPGMGAPKDSAARNLNFLREVESALL